MFDFVFFAVILKIELYTSEVVNPIIQDRPIHIDVLKEIVSLGWVSSNSGDFCGFLYVWLISVSQFLVIESIKSSVLLQV